MVKLEKITPNFHKVTFGDTKVIYFSYEVPIAFYDDMKSELILTPLYQIPNGGSTTGKHLKAAMASHKLVKRTLNSHVALQEAIINNF